MAAAEIIIWILFAIACARVANSKGRDQYKWGAIGLLTGIFGLIAVACMKSKKVEPQPAQPAAEDDLTRVTRLAELRDRGAISEEEFEYQKSLVLR